MITPRGKIYLKGKRISPSKASALICKAAENITMAGFTNAEQLYQMVMTNSNESKVIANYVLLNMLEDYLCTLGRECERMYFEDRKTSAFNAKLHNQNITIINEVIGMLIDSNIPVPVYDEEDDEDFDEDDDGLLDFSKDEVLDVMPSNNLFPFEFTAGGN